MYFFLLPFPEAATFFALIDFWFFFLLSALFFSINFDFVGCFLSFFSSFSSFFSSFLSFDVLFSSFGRLFFSLFFSFEFSLLFDFDADLFFESLFFEAEEGLSSFLALFDEWFFSGDDFLALPFFSSDFSFLTAEIFFSADFSFLADFTFSLLFSFSVASSNFWISLLSFSLFYNVCSSSNLLVIHSLFRLKCQPCFLNQWLNIFSRWLYCKLEWIFNLN